jgi:hypothetical protein
LLRRAARPGGKQDSVRPRGVEFAESSVANTAIAKNLATLQLEITEIRKLLVAVLRAGNGADNNEPGD